jgi:hypothetical protein
LNGPAKSLQGLGMEMHPFFRFLDPYLIQLYRITGYALADFLLGTLVLAFIALIIGEFTISLAFLAARKRIDQTTAEASKYQNLSIDALKAGDKETYKAANKLANDAFGKSFFMQIALSAAFLWPAFLALAWMSYRFSDIEFPLPYTHHSLGHIGVFILLFAAAYLLFRMVKYKLPYFRRIKEILDSYNRRTYEMKSFADLLTPAKPDEKP